MSSDFIAKFKRRLTRGRATAARRVGNDARDRGDWNTAVAAYRDYLVLRPQDGPLWIQLGHMLAHAGHLDDALDAYRNAQARIVPDADLHLHLGRVLRHMGDDAAAAVQFASSYLIDPTLGAGRELLDARGLAHARSGFAALGMDELSVVGNVERASLGCVAGWALDPSAPQAPAVIEFLNGDMTIATVVADLPRPDLSRAGFDPGARGGGFLLEMSQLETDAFGDAPIVARLQSTGIVLAGSPFQISTPPAYRAWMARTAVRTTVPWPAPSPRLTFIMPVHDPDPVWLAEAIESVRTQDIADWALICIDDGSRDPRIGEMLSSAATDDSRIRILTIPAGGTARATNAGLRNAISPWVAFLDHDDRLEPEAARRILEAADLGADMIYSDEVQTWQDAGVIRNVEARPAFSHDHYLSHPYFVHLVAIPRQVALQAGGLDETLVASTDVDFVLRILEVSRSIAHIPAVLYRWRTHSLSLGHRNQQAVTGATLSVLQQHLARMGQPAVVSEGPLFNTARIDWPVPQGRRTLAIIPTRNRADLLSQCLNSLACTVPAGAIDILVIDHQSDDPETRSLLQSLAGTATIMPYVGPFNFSRMNNEAVRRYGAEYDQFLFLNNDIEAIETGWFARLSGLCSRPDVGAAGSTLLYPDGRVQHAGVVVGLGGFAEHVFKFAPFTIDGRRNPGPGCALVSTRDVSAITAACMLVRRDAFERVGGFDEALAVGFNDTDLCLRIGRAGYRILADGLSVLMHHESATRRSSGDIDHPEDAARFLEVWGQMVRDGDPFFSPLWSHDPAVEGAVNLLDHFPVRLRPGPANGSPHPSLGGAG